MIPSGTILNYQARGVTKYFQSIDDIVRIMQPILAQANVTIRDYHSSITGVVGSVDAYLGAPVNFQLTATVQTSSDFGSQEDVKSLLDNAMYQATDKLPVSTIPSMTVPKGSGGSGSPTDTGDAPQADDNTNGAPATSWFDKLFQSGVNSFALLMVGVILAVILIVAGKQKGIV